MADDALMVIRVFQNILTYISLTIKKILLQAWVAELVDARDLKSLIA